MKKSRLLGAVCTCFISLLVLSTSANAVVIDFEDLSGNGVLPSNYAGLTWSADWSYYDSVQFPYTPSSGSTRIFQNSSIPTYFQFTSDVVFDGVYFSGSNTASYQLYNNGTLMHTSSTITLSETPTFLDSGYIGLIDEVVLVLSNGSFVMDDVTYNSSVVPVPAAAWLFGSGLLGLVGIARRKKAAYESGWNTRIHGGCHE